MKSILRHGLPVVALIMTGLAGWRLAQAPQWPARFATPEFAPPTCSGKAIFETRVVSAAEPHYAHATTAVELSDGRLRAFWYQGATELGPDVRLFTSVFDGASWTTPAAAIGPRETALATGRFVWKVGNPVVFRASESVLALVFASVGIGGWSATSLNVMRTTDDGETWSPPKRLQTSPTFNFATNVRGSAISFADGSTMLPAYNEFVRHFSEIYWLDANFDVRARRRIGVRPRSIQPFVMTVDDRRARAFMRTGARSVTLTSETRDAGWSWSPIAETTVPQFDKPVAIVALDARRWLMTSTSKGDTGALGPVVLSLSDDAGVTWKPFFTLPGPPQVKPPSMYYPWLMRGRDGMFHLFFTYRDESFSARGSHILHARFNLDWLASRGGPQCN